MDERVKQRQKDYHYRLSKEEGYRARSAYKLKEINKKYKVLKKGDLVVDLGASPGSWSQVAWEEVANGFVLSVDKILMPPLGKKNTKFILGDMSKKSLPAKIEKELRRKADVVLSDISPEFSGVKERDIGISADLNKIVFNFAKKILKTGGNLVIKVFQSQETEELIKEVKKDFERVRTIKPKSSTKKSSEMYLVALNFKNN